MADQKNRQQADRADELDEQQLDQVAGGTLSRTEASVAAPKKAFAAKYEDGIAENVAQVGLGVAAN